MKLLSVFWKCDQKHESIRKQWNWRLTWCTHDLYEEMKTFDHKFSHSQDFPGEVTEDASGEKIIGDNSSTWWSKKKKKKKKNVGQKS